MSDSVQTSYDEKIKRAYDGMKADMHSGTDVSKTVETTPIEFGRVVSLGSTDEKVVLGGAAAMGVSVRELELEGGIPQVASRIAVRSDGPVLITVDGAGAALAALNYDQVTGRLTTAAVLGDVIALPTGSAILSETKIDEAVAEDNIVRVNLVGLS